MKSIFIALMLTVSYISFCYGTESVTLSQAQQKCFARHYISVDQMLLCEEGMVICLEDSYLLAQSIFHDEMGFYYLEEGVSWICSNCGALNDLDNSVCCNCGESCKIN